jgi:sec-independent protein translocase protein TatA
MFRNPTADLLVVLLIVLLIFGPKRLPGLGKSLGHGLREFKESITGESKDENEAEPPALTQAASLPVPPPGDVVADSSPSPAAVERSATGAVPARDSAEVGSERSS